MNDTATRFAGRRRELTALTDALGGHGARLVDLVAEPGMGRSALLAEFLPAAAGHEVLAAAGGTGGAHPRLTAERLRGPLPEVLVVDDVHQASPEVVTALRELLRTPPPDLLLVLSHRPRQSPTHLLAALGTAATTWRTTRLELPPLTAAETESLLPGALCGRHRTTAHADSGGNPRYLRLLLSWCAGPDCGGGELFEEAAALPEQDAAELLLELEALPARALLVARAAAVAGPDTYLAAALAGLDHAELLSEVDTLVAADVLRPTNIPGRFAFRHPALRAVTYAASPAGWRLGAHAQAAESLRERGASAAGYARHVERAGQAGPAGTATLLAAADELAERAPGTAAGFYRAALRELPEAEAPAPLLALARCAVATGDLRGGAEALSRHDDLPSAAPGAGAETRALLAQHAGRYTQARSLLRKALSTVDSPQLRLLLAQTSLWDTGWYFSDDALLTATGSGDPALQALALAVHAITRLANGSAGPAQRSAREAARVADRQAGADLARTPSVLTSLGWVETHLEQHSAALRHFTQGLALSRASGRWPAMIPALTGLATVHLREGDLRAAAGAADQAVSLSEPPGAEDLRAMALTARAQVSLARGEVLAALADSHQAAILVPPDSPWWRRAHLTAAAAHLHDGDPATAVALTLDAAGGDTLLEVPAWDHVTAGSQLAHAELLLGNPAEATLWSKRVTESARTLGLPALTAQADLTAARVAQGPGEALVHATAALTTPNPLLKATAHTLAAQALTNLNEHARAADHRAAAQALTTRHGTTPLPTATPPQQPPNEQHVLSQREYEIATLVSQGRTNRQIARELDVSHKTVETHLGRIFTKLEVSSRAEIANMVGRATIKPRPKRTKTTT
ncbi:LuxR C-terminal-related transcriptional regulator [Saccharopolyspora indica]|uniref:helix-turn-helix transcriptional regulator n=1 Tax=Saccharopolyspora indica TaxID=1229659 RepID=UPI0022EAD886|nr:LuxR C-terminal-related transcriptional regulator [Saccharopolyspora indica]MDA3650030.1 LuxR C-terminal-related transcriptional regulator [Saccharopolyspora indica]